jgi:aspartate oxidase
MQCKGVVPVTTTIEGVVVVVGVAVAGLAIALAVPGVHHLMVWKKKRGGLRFHVTQLYAQGM